jgi:hypothetical protein
VLAYIASSPQQISNAENGDGNAFCSARALSELRSDPRYRSKRCSDGRN